MEDHATPVICVQCALRSPELCKASPIYLLVRMQTPACRWAWNPPDRRTRSQTLSFGLTLIVVNNTLVQQWADEIKKFAPGLRVRMFFGSSALKRQAMLGLRECDVLLTTPHMIGNAHHGWGATLLGAMQVHRVVVDEAHLLATASMGSKLLALRQLRTQHMWLVSGTPFSTSLSQLNKQAKP